MQASDKIKHAVEKQQYNKKLYEQLSSEQYHRHPFETRDLGEQMAIIHQSIGGWWKPRYLVNHLACEAYEFMDETERLLLVSDDDIEWESLMGLPSKAIARARAHSGLYPTVIRAYHNGEAEVTWQINPDGRYFMDEDGYGMTDDKEITLVGTIDRTGKVLRKFIYKG